MFQEPEDRLFLVDASRSMEWDFQFDDGRQSPLAMIKRALKEYVMRIAAHGYYDEKRRIGVIAYWATDLRQKLKVDEIIHLYNPPTSLPIYRIDDIKGSGSSCMGDALRYALLLMRESVRKRRRVKVLSDGECTSGVDPLSLTEELTQAKIVIDGVQVGGRMQSPILTKIAEQSAGRFLRVMSYQELLKTLDSP